MDPRIARASLRQLIALCLLDAGYRGIEEAAMGELELLVLRHLGDIVHYAQELSIAARRTRPQARDVLAACEHFGTSLEDIDKARGRNMGEEMANDSLERETAREEPKLVDVPPIREGESWRTRSRTLDIAPDKYPKLPHEHLYLQTPVFPTISSQAKDTAQVQLDHRAAQSRLVEDSLRNLVKATDAAAQPPARKPGLKLKMAGESVALVSWERVNAIEAASSATLKRIAAAAASPQASKRVRVHFPV